MNESNHKAGTNASTCRICCEWERDMNGTLVALNQTRNISKGLLDALEMLLDPNLSSDNPVELAAVEAFARRAVAEAKGLAA